MHRGLDKGLCGCYILASMTGAQLKAMREASGMTQKELAAELDVSQPYLAQIEAGGRRLSRRTAIAATAIINAHAETLAKAT